MDFASCHPHGTRPTAAAGRCDDAFIAAATGLLAFVHGAFSGRNGVTQEAHFEGLLRCDGSCKRHERVFGKSNVFTDAEPTMGGEDFSYMLQARPGAYVFLGQGGGPNNCFLHNPGYDFNDEVIPLGAGYLAALVEESLPLK